MQPRERRLAGGVGGVVGLRAARAVDRPRVRRRKLGLGAEEAGDEKVEETVELEHVVLQRRPRQDEPVARAQPLERERRLRPPVLDHVTLVEHDVLPPLLA